MKIYSDNVRGSIGLTILFVMTMLACRTLDPNAMPVSEAVENEQQMILATQTEQSEKTAITEQPPIMEKAPDAAWRPAVGDMLQLQFSDLPLVMDVDAAIYDIDLFDVAIEDIAFLHGRGVRVICYLNAGAWEDWREDASLFKEDGLGADYQGWPGERWLDIRRIDDLAPIMIARLEECRAKGFDGVEPDNLNGYENVTGFDLTAEDQLRYNVWLAAEAHRRGLAIGLKNDSEQIPDLVGHFDFLVLEDCFVQGWCELGQLFIQAGKPVFAIEYTDQSFNFEDFCAKMAELEFSGVLKNRSLDAYWLPCTKY